MKIRLITILLIIIMLISTWGLLSFNQTIVRAFELKDLKPDELTYSLQYTHSSKNRLVVNGYSFYDFVIIGQLEVEEKKSDLLSQVISVKYNLTPREDLTINIPVKYKNEDIISYTDNQNQYLSNLNGFGLGDLELTLSRHTNPTDNIIQVGFLTLKTKTGTSPYNLLDEEVAFGTGHIGVKCGFNSVLRVNPVMLFGSLNYCFNLAEQVKDYGVIDPGDTLQYSLGLAYALNKQIMLSSRFEQSLIGESSIDGEKKGDSDYNIATLYFELDYLNDNQVDYKYTLGIGLTDDSPDFSFGISMPVSL